jgi:hypothetical protein
MRHEIPTHVNVEDKAILGLTMRQVMEIMTGLSAAYGLWNQFPDLPLALRMVLALGFLLAITVVALIRPLGRPLEDWLIVGLRYLAIPKTYVYRPTMDPHQWLSKTADWEELMPQVRWQEKPE